MRLPVSHIAIYQVGATFITEGPNSIEQIRPPAAPSFHTCCLVLVTGIKIHFVVLQLARGPQVTHSGCQMAGISPARLVFYCYFTANLAETGKKPVF